MKRIRTAAAIVLTLSALGLMSAPVAQATSPATDVRMTVLDVQAIACEAITFSGNIAGPACQQVIVMDAAQDLLDIAYAPFTSKF